MIKVSELCLSIGLTGSMISVLMLASPSANAQLVVCPLDTAIRNLEDVNGKINYAMAQETTLILGQMNELNAKAENPTLPLKDQLSRSDSAAFQLLREQLLAVQGRKIVESGYLRDARVIAETATVARTMSQGVRIDEHDPKFFFFGIIGMMRLQHGADKLQLTTPKRPYQCDVDAGLHFNEQLALKQFSRLDIQKTEDRARTIAKKYGLDFSSNDWTAKIPSNQDRQVAQGDMMTIQAAYLTREYINDLENLKALNHVAILGYLSDRDDLEHARSEAEIAKLGTSWSEKLTKFDDWTKFLSSVQAMIEQRVPSDASIEAQGLSNRLKQQYPEK